MSDFNLDAERLDIVVRKVESHDALLSTMTIQVQEIHTALLGTYDKQGLVSKVRDAERTIEIQGGQVAAMEKRHSRGRKTPEWIEHAFKGAVAAAFAYFGIKGAS